MSSMASRSSSRTKSFSVPCPLVNDHLRMRSVWHSAGAAIRTARTRGRARSGAVVGQPADPRVLAEPGVLPSGEPASAATVASRPRPPRRSRRRGSPAPAGSPGPGTRCVPRAARRRPAPHLGDQPRPPTSGPPAPRSVRRAWAGRCQARSGPRRAARSAVVGRVGPNGRPVSAMTSSARTIRARSRARSARRRTGRTRQAAGASLASDPGQLLLEAGPAELDQSPGTRSRRRSPGRRARTADHDRDPSRRRQSAMPARASRWNSATVAVCRTSRTSIR